MLFKTRKAALAAAEEWCDVLARVEREQVCPLGVRKLTIALGHLHEPYYPDEEWNR